MSICLLPEKITEFQKALKERKIKIEDLLNMTTEARTALLEKYAGPNAKEVNTLFEEKLVLKNRLQGIKNWAAKVGEVGRYDPAKKANLDRLMSEYRAKQQERIFSPKEHEAFLNDLVEEKFGTRITKDEAKNVFDATAKADELRQKMEASPRRAPGQKPTLDEAAYGAAKVILENYVDDLKGENYSVKDLVKGRLQQARQELKDNPVKAVLSLAGDALKTISDNSIGLVASVDISFLGRQGLRTLMTHPTRWWPGAQGAFVDFAKTIGGKETADALKADLYSNPNYEAYKTAGLIPKTEEQYPTSIPERIPGVGRVFKASEVAFNGAAIRMRTGLYDLFARQAEKNGVDVTDEAWIKDQGRAIGSLTARGELGRTATAASRIVLWAPKMLKANWDVLTAHTFGAGLETPSARREAVVNLTKIVAETALLMTIASAIAPNSVEKDPRSSDFGKIRWTDAKGFKHTIDYTGGAGSLIVLASRLITNSSKTSSGITKTFGSGYGQQNFIDVLTDFALGKTTPPISALVALWKGVDFTGKPATVANQLPKVVLPITIQNAIQMKDDASVSTVIGVILDGLGLNSSSYQPGQKDWAQNPGKELQQFKTKVGDKTFNEANTVYNKKVTDWLQNVKQDDRFKGLTDEQKQKVITAKKGDFQDEVFKQYGFKYHAPKTEKLPKFASNATNAAASRLDQAWSSRLSSSDGLKESYAFGQYDSQKGLAMGLNKVYPVSQYLNTLLNNKTKVSLFDKSADKPYGGVTKKPLVANHAMFNVPGLRVNVEGQTDAGNLVRTTMHELIHVGQGELKLTPAYYENFNKRWESTTDPATKKELSDIDAIIGGDEIYSGIDPQNKAQERMAYLGDQVGMGGLKAFPPQLRPFYTSFFK